MIFKLCNRRIRHEIQNFNKRWFNLLPEIKNINSNKKGKYEKDFLNTILQNLESICSEQPAITYHELCNRIGTPKDIIIEYYENADTEYVIQKLRISSIIRHIVISILLIAVVVASIELYSFHKLYTQVDHSIDGYSIETPPTEVP